MLLVLVDTFQIKVRVLLVEGVPLSLKIPLSLGGHETTAKIAEALAGSSVSMMLRPRSAWTVRLQATIMTMRVQTTKMIDIVP